jgi:methylphosphotriester-DNA--protein-cysteine methyltransferase
MHSVQSAQLPVMPEAAHLVSALLVDDSLRALARIATPSPCTQLVARFGPAVPGNVDVHVLGAQRRVRRKQVGAGHRAIVLRLHPGMQRAVAGAAPEALIGRVVAIEELWGAEAGTRLRARLAEATDAGAAAALLQAAIVERAAGARHAPSATPRLAAALARLQSAGVAEAARALGVSERQLRRDFRDALGLPPKAVARLDRFARALRAAHAGAQASWASIAADAGYYDQAHLIAEFNAIAGVGPQALLAELRVAAPVGWTRPVRVVATGAR